MKNYIDNNNKIYAYEDTIEEDTLAIKIEELGLISITDEELAILMLPTLDEAKTIKTNEIKKANEIADQLDIDYMSTTFQADKYSQDLIVSVLSAGSVPDGFFWLDKSNNQVAITYVELQGLSATILARGQANFVKYQDLKAQINLAKTQADLDLIAW